MLHERTTATDSSSVTPALLLALCLLARGDAAADPAATPHNACGRRVCSLTGELRLKMPPSQVQETPPSISMRPWDPLHL